MSSNRRPAGGRTGAGPLIMAYALLTYALFLAVTVYSVFFFAGRGLPRTIDSGPQAPWPAAVAVDLGLLLLFAVQHSVMARPWFKRRWTRVVPAAAERSTYVLATCAVLILQFGLWRPLDGRVWTVRGPGAWLLTAVYAAGWLLASVATELISQPELVGLCEASFHLLQRG